MEDMYTWVDAAYEVQNNMRIHRRQNDVGFGKNGL